MHIVQPRHSRNVAGAVLNMLFPLIVPAAFISAVTGTNGKTTTTRLLAHIFKQTGRTVATLPPMASAITGGTGTIPVPSARLLLQDPTVEVAVLESVAAYTVWTGL